MEQIDTVPGHADQYASLQFPNTVAEGKISRELVAEHDKVHTHWIAICPKTTIEKLWMMNETFCEPGRKLLSFLKGKHDARAAILQIAIRRASARRHDIICIVLPQEARQMHYVHAGNVFLHMVIRI
jgi:hypothetical protein